MARIVDARNLSCPQPVLLTAEALDKTEEVTTIVDNQEAVENVSRLGKSRGLEVTVDHRTDGFYLKLVKKGTSPIKEESLLVNTGTVLFISSDILGRGENIALGNLLMQSFLNTLSPFNSKPETIVFINNGVKLVIGDSPVVGELKQLEGQGVEILACGTCLSRFNLTDKIAVGQVSNMYTITETLLKANKVISL